MLRPNEPIPLRRELIFQIEKITAVTMVNPANLELKIRNATIDDLLVLELVRKVCFVPAQTTVSHPYSWWDAFKERWFPVWARRRWPVKYKTWEARAMFPALESFIPAQHRFVHNFTWKEQKDG